MLTIRMNRHFEEVDSQHCKGVCGLFIDKPAVISPTHCIQAISYYLLLALTHAPHGQS